MKIRVETAFATAVLSLASAAAATAMGPSIRVPVPGVGGGLGASFFAPNTSPQSFRHMMTLAVDGRLKSARFSTAPDASTIRLHVDNQDILMIAVDVRRAELTIHPNEDYERDLYRSISTKRIQVIADDFTRDRIIKAADAGEPLEINGYVFDATSPYLVVKSIREDKAR